ncbi:hypothetical protein [Flavobacterium sp. HSC-61S13]|uniref:hypothetical protein n=1 Tax=Flavobacterium sp. HSC-61S13 TaxID=2910963 RepID=UPI0020A12C4F|nr:hypothetical protein [Flavobacterium sp. HSC-61S13]MCP1997183.1 hypothetical protein [Flavobacterium sp. HSC-61S13]
MKYLLILMYFFMMGCTSYKTQLRSNGNYEAAIENSIIDFSKTNLFNHDSVFRIRYKILEENLYFISIIGDSENKFLYSKEKKFEENKLPNRFFIHQNKLFIWSDSNHQSNKEILGVLESRNLIQDEEKYGFYVLDYSIEDDKKGAKYYFCKNNLKKYKRVITNLGIIKTPKLNCE